MTPTWLAVLSTLGGFLGGLSGVYLQAHLSARHQLRFAALDQRLQVHQMAFWYCSQVIMTSGMQHAHKTQEDAWTWFNQNALYLEADVREGYIKMLEDGKLLDQLKQKRRQGQKVDSELDKALEALVNFANTVIEAAQLPRLKGLERKRWTGYLTKTSER